MHFNFRLPGYLAIGNWKITAFLFSFILNVMLVYRFILDALETHNGTGPLYINTYYKFIYRYVQKY